MKNTYYIIISLILLLSSCKQSKMSSDDAVVEGEPLHISVNIDDAVLTRSGLSQSQEKAINNVFIMVFDKRGTKVSQSYFSSDIPSNLTNVPTVSGTNMSVYVVVNLSPQNTGSSAVRHYFDNVHTVAQLNQVMLYDLANDLNINRDLVMQGSVTGLTISAIATQNVTVTMHYPVAKVTLYVVKALTNASDSYNLTNWTVTNYPQKSYIFPQATDAGTSASDFANSATSISWVDTTLVISGASTPAKYAFLYMYENRGGTNSNTTEAQKAGNAPSNATAIVLQGYYKTNATNTVTGVTTTIYLGNNNYNDYNVNRGNEYSYIATIKGINQIDIDSRVKSNTYGYQVNVNNTTLDCHPDWRPLQINSWPGIATINVYNSDGVTPCTWLKVSTINLNKAVNNARPTYDPAVDMVNTLALTFPTNSPQAIASQMVYLYADENFSTTSRNAVISVTSTASLTNSQTITIPITQLGYQLMGPSVGFRTFTTAGNLNTGPGVDYTLVIENIEEATLNLTPGAVAGTEATTSMQWGFNGSIVEPTSGFSRDYYYRDGYEISLGLIFASGGGALNSTLRPPYGRASAASSGAASVTITENDMNPIFNTYPARYCFEKNRDVDGDGKITNPNTKGFNEIIWYLPAADELYAMYVGQYALTYSLFGSNYQVSSEVYGSANSTNSMSYSTGISGSIGKSQAVNVRCVRRRNQTLPAGTQNSPYVESASRIINNNGYASTILRTTNVACPVPMNSQNSTINNKLSPRFQVAKTDCLLNGSTGAATMTWAQANGWTTVSDNSSSAGVVASPATGCNAYSEPGYPAGTWRLPTQREMYILLFMRKELVVGQDGYTKMSAASYWAASNLGATLGWYSITGNTTVGFGGKTSAFAARCIRDL